jgi:hypothetical protein
MVVAIPGRIGPDGTSSLFARGFPLWLAESPRLNRALRRGTSTTRSTKNTKKGASTVGQDLRQRMNLHLVAVAVLPDKGTTDGRGEGTTDRSDTTNQEHPSRPVHRCQPCDPWSIGCPCLEEAASSRSRSAPARRSRSRRGVTHTAFLCSATSASRRCIRWL